MARVTVEDCVIIVPNRFELCLIANFRAKKISTGATTTLDKTSKKGKKEKTSVTALREIAEELIDVKNIRELIVRSIMKSDSTYDESIINDNTSETIIEEIDNQNLVLKDNTFLEDNIIIDD